MATIRRLPPSRDEVESARWRKDAHALRAYREARAQGADALELRLLNSVLQRRMRCPRLRS
jgi:hypothetical protein